MLPIEILTRLDLENDTDKVVRTKDLFNYCKALSNRSESLGEYQESIDNLIYELTYEP